MVTDVNKGAFFLGGNDDAGMIGTSKVCAWPNQRLVRIFFREMWAGHDFTNT